MDDIRELYQQTIIDHGRRPRNFHALPDATQIQIGHNPLCGDQLTLFLKVKEGIIEDLSFEGQGCAISMASSSLMTEKLKGMPLTEALQLFETIHQMLLGKSEPQSFDKIGKLSVLSGVKDFPARVKCASLPWHTLQAALKGDTQEVSTE
ncbi:MAG: SUF system NifU family Fe-S cluster assembly protein [Gammaproteobacteria bacterium]|nr:SUF system NifU family Fe-S cluster assembly protein [Gammaproteobacteria bacterium]